MRSPSAAGFGLRRPRRDLRRRGRLLDGRLFLTGKFALSGRHANLHGFRQRGSVGVGVGGIQQLLGCRAVALVAPVTDEDRRARGKDAPQAPHQIADMGRVRVRAEIREANKLRL